MSKLNLRISGLEFTAQNIERLLVTADALDIGRGVVVSVHGHVFRGETGWQFYREGERKGNYSGNPHVRRVDAAKEPTAVMRQHVRDAIVAGADAFCEEHPTAMIDAQRAASTAAALRRRGVIRALHSLIEQLDREVTALEAGGREVWREHRHGSSFTETVRHVLTADGDLLPSLPDVSVPGAHQRGPAHPDAVKAVRGESL